MGKKKTSDLTHKSKESHRLPCKISKEQKAEAADQLATAIQEADSLELERKTTLKDLGSRKEALIEKIHKLTQQVKDGVEQRSVDCELQLNYTKLTATLVRLDTEEIVEERPMTEEEKQMNFE